VEKTINNLKDGNNYKIEKKDTSRVVRSAEQVVYRISLMNDLVILEISEKQDRL